MVADGGQRKVLHSFNSQKPSYQDFFSSFGRQKLITLNCTHKESDWQTKKEVEEMFFVIGFFVFLSSFYFQDSFFFFLFLLFCS